MIIIDVIKYNPIHFYLKCNVIYHKQKFTFSLITMSDRKKCILNRLKTYKIIDIPIYIGAQDYNNRNLFKWVFKQIDQWYKQIG